MIGIAPEWQPYFAAFREDAHQIIAWAYQDARPLLHCYAQEEELTGLLKEAIDRRYDESEMDERFYHYDVVEDEPIPGEDRLGRRRRRPDIVIRWKARGLKPRPRYVFEAKCLRSRTHPIRKYAGPDGLQRFVSRSSYSEFASAAAMLGYVQTDTPDTWIEKLRAHIEGSKSTNPSVLEGLREAPVAPEPLGKIYTSAHKRFDGAAIEVAHILLDCTDQLSL